MAEAVTCNRKNRLRKKTGQKKAKAISLIYFVLR